MSTSPSPAQQQSKQSTAGFCKMQDLGQRLNIPGVVVQTNPERSANMQAIGVFEADGWQRLATKARVCVPGPSYVMPVSASKEMAGPCTRLETTAQLLGNDRVGLGPHAKEAAFHGHHVLREHYHTSYSLRKPWVKMVG